MSRTTGDPIAAARVLRETVRTLDADMPIENVRTLVTGTLACLGPAWRATTVDPMIALRAE